MEFIITKSDAGSTVLSYLKKKIKISSSALSSLKRVDMGISVNGMHVTVRYTLCENDVLTVKDSDSFADVNEAVEPHNIPLDIILENDDLIIVNKPAFMPTHPSHNHKDDTLANALAYIYAQRNIPLVFRPIGRLDRNTSGISLIAKNSISASFLINSDTNVFPGKNSTSGSGTPKKNLAISTAFLSMPRKISALMASSLTSV